MGRAAGGRKWCAGVHDSRDAAPPPAGPSSPGNSGRGRFNAVLAEFLRGPLAVMGLLAAYYAVALWLGDIDFSLPIALVAGGLALVPDLGFLGVLLALPASAVLGRRPGGHQRMTIMGPASATRHRPPPADRQVGSTSTALRGRGTR